MTGPTNEPTIPVAVLCVCLHRAEVEEMEGGGNEVSNGVIAMSGSKN